MSKRVFLMVLDSFGIGAEPDAPAFGDYGVNTLAHIVDSPLFKGENLAKLGLFNIEGVDCRPGTSQPLGAYARLQEASMGKDTTIGHWEIAGVESDSPLPTYPEGFPQEVLEEFTARTGYEVLCNKPYSGTQVLKDYGEEHLKTGKLILYTSADSVFQIAAHEELVPVEKLYEICATAREILTGKHGVGRVIARPFVGTNKDDFRRTSNRHDFSLMPPRDTLLDYLGKAGLDVIGVGKIYDIFAGKGVPEPLRTRDNGHGLEMTSDIQKQDFHGLAFVNLVDFDMLFGHRRDVDGYAKATAQFDDWLPGFMEQMGPEDILMITADHGCDPAYTQTTDHTREYVPLLVYGQPVKAGVDCGTVLGFGAIAKTICDYLGVDSTGLDGTSLWDKIKKA